MCGNIQSPDIGECRMQIVGIMTAFAFFAAACALATVICLRVPLWQRVPLAACVGILVFTVFKAYLLKPAFRLLIGNG